MGRWESKQRMAERRKRVAELKALGLSHPKIARRMGITTSISESDYRRYKEERNGTKSTER